MIQFPQDSVHFEAEQLIHEIGKMIVDDIQTNKSLTQEVFFLMLPKAARVIAIRDLHK
jgi:hypothetical protein